MAKVVVAAVLLLVLWVGVSIAMMWPPICHYAGESANACINNLRQIDGAKEQWAMEFKQTNGPVNPAQLDKLYLRQPPKCPSGGTYYYGNIGQSPVCSLSTNAAPPAVRERRGPFFWRWKIWPSSGPSSHKLPE